MSGVELKSQVSLKPFNTFGIEAKAEKFGEFNSLDDLKQLWTKGVFTKRHLILGGGSNVLLVGDFDGIVLKNNLLGRTVESTDDKGTVIKLMAGENWHESVLWTLDQTLGGIENMSLIPGTVGAAPMQNIGAYGVEIKDVFHSLEAFDKETGEMKVFSGEECHFGYRESIFKNKLKNRYIIFSVKLTLTNMLEKDGYTPKTSYGAITAELEQKGIELPTARDVSNAVIKIRQSKLPDPSEIGNAGSFFKNPIVSKEIADDLKSQYPNIPQYPAPNNTIKLAAGWLIEQSGWKGKRVGNVGSHAKQALVLVNYGRAVGNEIVELSKDIQASVKQKFNVQLEPEVNFI